jgi:hypothetical protein
MSLYYCPDCKRDRRFNLFVEVAIIYETTAQILASCSSCNKGKWIEIMKDVYERLKSEHDK